MNMTFEELRDWKHKYAELLVPRAISVNGVHFSKFCGSIQFSYKNSSGLIFADNGYLGNRPDNENYYPLVRLSVRYSKECKFNPTCQPDLGSMASAVKYSWEEFIKG